jgi:hypothetical protein
VRSVAGLVQGGDVEVRYSMDWRREEAAAGVGIQRSTSGGGIGSQEREVRERVGLGEMRVGF